MNVNRFVCEEINILNEMKKTFYLKNNGVNWLQSESKIIFICNPSLNRLNQ